MSGLSCNPVATQLVNVGIYPRRVRLERRKEVKVKKVLLTMYLNKFDDLRRSSNGVRNAERRSRLYLVLFGTNVVTSAKIMRKVFGRRLRGSTATDYKAVDEM